MTRFFLLFFIFIFNSLLIAQNNEVDLRKISSAKLYIQMVENTREHPEKTIEYAQILLERCIENKQKDTAALAYIYLGRANRVLGDEKRAIELIDNGIDFVESNDLNATFLTQLYIAKGNSLSDQGMEKEALALFFKALSIATEIKDEKSIILINNSIAYIYSVSDELAKAKSILLNIIKKLDKLQFTDPDLYSTSYRSRMALSNIYIKEEKLDSALIYNKQGLQRALTTSDAFSIGGFYDYIGIIELKKGEYEKALVSLNKALEYSEKIGNGNTIMPTKYNIASYYYKKSNFNEAINILEKVISITKRDSLQYPEIPEVYNLLAKSYKEINNLEKANENFEAYILNQNASEKSKNNVTRAIYNKEISNLNKKKDTENRSLLAIIGVISVVVLSLLLLLLKFYKLKKKNELKFQELLEKVNSDNNSKPIIDTKDFNLEEKNSSDVSEEITNQILIGLKKLEEQEYFLSQDCNAYNVARKIKTNTSYLSKVVNSNYQKNFNTYINDLRINYSIVRLKNDRKFRLFSIQSIAEEIGYKSADSFTKYFKQQTDLNPSFYIKQLNSIS